MKLALGTVQFGMNYGIANGGGQVAFEEVNRILSYGRTVGIDLLDTAAAYGDSETVLGNIGVQGWQLVSKIAPLPDSVADVESWVIGEVEASLARLNVSSLSGILMHRPEDLLGDHGAAYQRGLERLRDEGRVGAIGYSIYSPTILEALTCRLWPDLVQTPFNVFDQRIRSSGWLERLHERGCRVHARSVFLQGLLLMPVTQRPTYFTPWHDVLSRWSALFDAPTRSPLATALGFVLNETRLDRVVVGVDNLEQLEQLVLACREPVVHGLEALECNDPGLIEPFRWKLK